MLTLKCSLSHQIEIATFAVDLLCLMAIGESGDSAKKEANTEYMRDILIYKLFLSKKLFLESEIQYQYQFTRVSDSKTYI